MVALKEWLGDNPASALADCWGRVAVQFPARPGVVPESLLDLAGIDEILSTRLLRYPDFRLIRDGDVVDIASYVRREADEFGVTSLIPDYDALYGWLDRGATLVLRNVHRYWRPVRDLGRELERLVGLPAPCTAFYTPCNSSGLPIHRDSYEGLALQTVGQKSWQVFESADAATMLTMAAGDVLYIPSHLPHQAAAQAAASVHVTYTLTASQWRQALAEMLRSPSPDRVALDRILPFTDDHEAQFEDVRTELHDWVDGLHAATVAAWLRANRPSTAHAAGLPSVLGIARAAQIDDTTVVSWNPDVQATIEVRDESLRLQLVDRHIDMPARLAPTIELLRSGLPRCVGELQSALTESGNRRVLVRRLVREGVLRIAESADDGGRR